MNSKNKKILLSALLTLANTDESIPSHDGGTQEFKYSVLHLPSQKVFEKKGLFRNKNHLLEKLNDWNRQKDYKYWYGPAIKY